MLYGTQANLPQEKEWRQDILTAELIFIYYT